MKQCVKYFAILFSVFFVSIIGYIYNEQCDKTVTLIYWEEIKNVFVSKPWFSYMKKRFAEYGYSLKVSDNIENSDIVIWGCPCELNFSDINKNTLLVGWLQESPISLQQPPIETFADRFDRMYTWRKDLVDNDKYFYIPILNRVGEINDKLWDKSKKVLVTQVASYYNDPNLGIYNERLIATKWFLYNAPDDFKLYGKNWGALKFEMPEEYLDVFDNMYGGIIKDKYKATSQSKFVLAYENTIHNDYVSEKIYDVLQSGSVPVYYGAPNITDYVPKECFIDRRDFVGYKDLYTFLKNMTDETYESYRKCAYDFIQTQRKQHEKVIDILVDGIFNDLIKNKQPLGDRH